MPTFREVLIGHVLPGIIALVGLMLLALFSRKSPKWNSAAPIVLGAAFTLGYYLLHPVYSFPPQDQSGWLVYLIPIIAIVASINFSRAPIVLAIAVGFTWLLVVPFHRTTPIDWTSIAIVSAIVWLLWFSFDRLSLRRNRREMSTLFVLIALFTAAMLGMSGSAIFGLQGGTFVAVAVAMLIVTCITRLPLLRGIILLFVFIWTGLLINGRFWSDLSLLHALLLISPTLLVWAGQLPWLKKPGFWHATLRLSIVLIPLVIAGITAAIQFQKDMQDLGY